MELVLIRLQQGKKKIITLYFWRNGTTEMIKGYINGWMLGKEGRKMF